MPSLNIAEISNRIASLDASLESLCSCGAEIAERVEAEVSERRRSLNASFGDYAWAFLREELWREEVRNVERKAVSLAAERNEAVSELCGAMFYRCTA